MPWVVTGPENLYVTPADVEKHGAGCNCPMCRYYLGLRATKGLRSDERRARVTKKMCEDLEQSYRAVAAEERQTRAKQEVDSHPLALSTRVASVVVSGPAFRFARLCLLGRRSRLLFGFARPRLGAPAVVFFYFVWAQASCLLSGSALFWYLSYGVCWLRDG